MVVQVWEVPAGSLGFLGKPLSTLQLLSYLSCKRALEALEGSQKLSYYSLKEDPLMPSGPRWGSGTQNRLC